MNHPMHSCVQQQNVICSKLMTSNVFTIMAQKDMSPLSHSQNYCHPEWLPHKQLPIPKGQENWLPESTIFACIKKETRSNEMIETEPPCSIQQQNVI